MLRTLLLILTPYRCGATYGQAAPTDSQTLQALLAEVRQLRHDLQTTAATAQRAQIALYRLQRQDEAVARPTEHLSDARSKLGNVEADRNKKAGEIQSAKAALSHNDAPAAQTHFEEAVLPEITS